jgi:hypothetical protein
VLADVMILSVGSSETSKTHACGLRWVPERREVIGVVTLFNYVTYWVRMCGTDTEEWAGISFRHFFDPISCTISEAPQSDQCSRNTLLACLFAFNQRANPIP